MRRLWMQVAQTSGAKIYALLAGLVVLAITARYLGPSGRGVVVAATGWATTLATFGGLSLGQVAIYHAAGRDPSEWLAPTLSVMLLYLALLTVIGWTAAAAAYAITRGGLFPHIPPLALALALLTVPGLIWSEYATSLLMALDSLPTANTAQAVSSTVNAAAVTLLLQFTALGIYAPLLATAMAALLAAIVTARAIRLRSQLRRPARADARRMVVGGLKLHANAIGTVLFTQATLLIVNYYRPSADTAFFGLAVQLMLVAQIVPNAMGMVAYTLVGRMGPDRAWSQQRHLLLQGVAVAALIVAVGYVAAPLAVRIVAGRAFLPAVPLFRIMIPSLFGMMLSSVMASQWIGRGYFTAAAGATLATGAVNLTLALLLVPRFGAAGAAWSTLIVYAIVALVNAAVGLWIHQQLHATPARVSPSLAE